MTNSSLSNCGHILNTNGGGIYGGIGSVIHLSTSVLHSNSGDFGGAVYVLDSDVTIHDCSFYNNTATNDGGAVTAWNTRTKVLVFTSRFFNNTSEDDGGAIALYSGADLTISNSHIVNNKAAMDGGGVYVITDAKFAAINSVIHNNTAGKTGDDIYCYSRDVIMDNGTLQKTYDMFINTPHTCRLTVLNTTRTYPPLRDAVDIYTGVKVDNIDNDVDNSIDNNIDNRIDNNVAKALVSEVSAAGDITRNLVSIPMALILFYILR